MTPSEFAAWLGGCGAALGLLIKAGEWIGGRMAIHATERRRDITEMLDRQDSEIKELRAALNSERDDCEERVKSLEERVQQAERDRARMEGVLYRMGWERDGERWKRQQNPSTEDV